MVGLASFIAVTSVSALKGALSIVSMCDLAGCRKSGDYMLLISSSLASC